MIDDICVPFMISRIIDDVFLTIARFSTVRRLLGCYTLQKINKLIWNTGIAWNTVLCNFSLQTNGFPYLCEVYVHIYLYLYPYRYLYSLGNKRIHFFCGKYFFLDTLAAVNIGYDKCPILETC